MATKHIAMIGEGAWGTAVATLLAHNGYQVRLWCYHEQVAASIQKTRHNERYLPGVTLSDRIEASTNLEYVLCKAEWIFEAIPVQYLRDILLKAQACFDPQQKWVVLSKGIEQDSLLFPTQIIDDVFEKTVSKTVFAGPSFAQDVANKHITAVTIASSDCEVGRSVQHMLANDYFRPYISTDIIGVQAASALKNVITLGVGLLEGAGYTDNTQAFLLTRGLQEIRLVIEALGGNSETAYGLSGMGDLVLTALGKLSKNKKVAYRLAKGERLDTILKETGYIPEGINTLKSVHTLINNHQLTLPICRGIYEVIINNKPIEIMLQELMDLPLTRECDS